jgi:hypothetical protein
MPKNKIDILLQRLYILFLVVALFTGFGNMPIYKRYYISTIPGLGWAGNFYINLNVHYIIGALLLGIAAYFALVHLKRRSHKIHLTTTGALRAAILGLSLVTGILLAIRNLTSVNFTFASQMTVAFVHLGMAMILLVLSVVCGIIKSPWTRLGREDDYA